MAGQRILPVNGIGGAEDDVGLRHPVGLELEQPGGSGDGRYAIRNNTIRNYRGRGLFVFATGTATDAAVTTWLHRIAVTDHHQVHGALRAREAQLRLVTDYAPVFITPNGRPPEMRRALRGPCTLSR